MKSIVRGCILALSAIFVIACSESGGGGIQGGSSGSQIPGGPEAQDYSRASFINQKLGRGVNFGNAFDAQCRSNTAYPYTTALQQPENGNGSWDGCWGNSIKDDYYGIIKAAGFKSIRLPVRWAEKASDVYPFTIPTSFTASVKAVVDKAIAEGFPVILNIHHYNELYDDNKKRNDLELQKQKFVELWQQIADEFKGYSNDYLIFEILNEPRSRIAVSVLNQLLENVWPIIRESNPDRTLMINSTEWGAYYTLPYIKIPNNDANVILSGHYYDPHKFTHQGDPNNPNYPAGEPWGTATDRQKLKQDIKKTYDELKAKYVGTDGGTIPINIGEFGASKAAAIADRVAWTSSVREEFEKYGFSWHYWAFPNAGLWDCYNYGQQKWIPEILKSLIPETP
jgi:endoglucanase